VLPTTFGVCAAAVFTSSEFDPVRFFVIWSPIVKSSAPPVFMSVGCPHFSVSDFNGHQ